MNVRQQVRCLIDVREEVDYRVLGRLHLAGDPWLHTELVVGLVAAMGAAIAQQEIRRKDGSKKKDQIERSDAGCSLWNSVA